MNYSIYFKRNLQIYYISIEFIYVLRSNKNNVIAIRQYTVRGL